MNDVLNNKAWLENREAINTHRTDVTENPQIDDVILKIFVLPKIVIESEVTVRWQGTANKQIFISKVGKKWSAVCELCFTQHFDIVYTLFYEFFIYFLS